MKRTVDDLFFAPDEFCHLLPLASYAAIGDGQSVALIGLDGTAAWWCVPDLDSLPLFDQLINPEQGSFFAVRPAAPYTAVQSYREKSNVLETVFITEEGTVRVTDSLNSTLAGRLPWCEFARRIEVLQGAVTMQVKLVCRAASDSESLNSDPLVEGTILFKAGDVSAALRTSENLALAKASQYEFVGTATLSEGERAVVAIIAVQQRPLGIPSIEDIDHRIDLSDYAWRNWAEGLSYDGPHAGAVVRSALILKLLLFSPSGAIAAAATTSLPEKIGSNKNYDYRYAWVRDASYTLHAFLWLDQLEESHAALSWLLEQLGNEGARVCFRLHGGPVPQVLETDHPGYCGSRPVVTGNTAGSQHQHGIYGDIFEAAALFVARGNFLDQTSVEVLSDLADECLERWPEKDSGMWELSELRHYTMSKVSAWQALNRAIELATKGALPVTKIARWSHERERIAAWVDDHCWSEKLSAYTFYPRTDRLDASLVLAIRFGFPNLKRLSSTCDVIREKLSHGPWLYRYSGAEKEESAFIACTFWLAEAYATLGRKQEANDLIVAALGQLPQGAGVLSEMIDPGSGEFLGNLPQGLSHLALVHAVLSL